MPHNTTRAFSRVFALLCLSAAAAQAAPNGLTGPNDPSSWTLEKHEKATATIDTKDGALHLTVDGAGGPSWHIQLFQHGLPLQDGVSYVVQFQAKASVPSHVEVYATADTGDTHNVGLASGADLSSDFKPFKLTFTASKTLPDHSRAPVFALAHVQGEVWLKDVSITRADGQAFAQASIPPGWFPFAIPWDDATPGTATDVSFLNDTRPAGAHGRIVVKDGHFAEADTGWRVRFLGINFGALAAFPEHDDADKIAAALAKAGINVVRLHHMDNSWGPAEGSLIDRTLPDRQHLRADQLDRLDYLVSALRKNGIYSNINLKVSHDFTEADGFPESVKHLLWPFQKRIDVFCRRMIDLQKDYARQLLTHKNPYTGMTYVEDPSIAFVEINNENSLLGNPYEPLGRALIGHLPSPFSDELAGDWNIWLKKKYATDAALKAAWNPPTPANSPSLVTSKSIWTAEHEGRSNATITPTPATNAAAAPDAEINVLATDGPEWYVQAHLAGLDLKPATSYTVNFRIKSEKPRAVVLNATLDKADWHNLGLTENIAVTKEWKTCTFILDCTNPEPMHSRLAFIVGNYTGKLWISDLTLREGAFGAGLKPNESLGTVPLPTLMTRPQNADWVDFLADTERGYADEMRAFLRNDLGVKSNLTDTQVDYGGLTGVGREAGSDYIDAHAYWQHPSFPRGDWDARDWAIQNTPIINAFDKSRGGDLGALALIRMAKKPFTISEYDHPAPTDFAAEEVPLLASFAAQQDWDGVYLFGMGPYGVSRGMDHIDRFFDVWGHPAKRAFLPTAALLFRSGDLSPQGPLKTLELPPHAFDSYPFAAGAWQAASGQPIKPLASRMAVVESAGVTKPTLVVSDTASSGASSPRIITTPKGAAWLATSPSVVVAAGFITDQQLEAGPLTLNLQGNAFGTVTLAAIDGKSLASSKRLLLTVIARAANQGMGWNANRTSVSDKWGHGPVLAESFAGTCTLPVAAGKAMCYALDTNGRRGKEVALKETSAGHAELPLDPAAHTIWYEIVVQP